MASAKHPSACCSGPTAWLFFLTEMPLVRYCEHRGFGLHAILRTSVALIAISFALLNLFPHVALLWVGMMCLTVGEMLFFPFTNRMANERADRGSPARLHGPVHGGLEHRAHHRSQPGAQPHRVVRLHGYLVYDGGRARGRHGPALLVAAHDARGTNPTVGHPDHVPVPSRPRDQSPHPLDRCGLTLGRHPRVSVKVTLVALCIP